MVTNIIPIDNFETELLLIFQLYVLALSSTMRLRNNLPSARKHHCLPKKDNDELFEDVISSCNMTQCQTAFRKEQEDLIADVLRGKC